MANQGAKKRKEENARHMANLRRIIIACNVIYVLVRMVVFHSSFTWKHWIGLILTSVAYLFPYQQLARMAQPAYADDGELFDGGFDMNTGGVCGYLHDVIYITSFVQVMSIISEKFWYTYLVPLLPSISSWMTSQLVNVTQSVIDGIKTRRASLILSLLLQSSQNRSNLLVTASHNSVAFLAHTQVNSNHHWRNKLV